jgi:hypothetical protein
MPPKAAPPGARGRGLTVPGEAGRDPMQQADSPVGASSRAAPVSEGRPGRPQTGGPAAHQSGAVGWGRASSKWGCHVGQAEAVASGRIQAEGGGGLKRIGARRKAAGRGRGTLRPMPGEAFGPSGARGGLRPEGLFRTMVQEGRASGRLWDRGAERAAGRSAGAAPRLAEARPRAAWTRGLWKGWVGRPRGLRALFRPRQTSVGPGGQGWRVGPTSLRGPRP